MNWSALESPQQIQSIKIESANQPVLIFKHSTRCGTSHMVLSRFERQVAQNELNARLYFLDLLAYRDISNQIAQAFDVPHESPQVLIIKDGKAVWNDSHLGIEFRTIQQVLQNLTAKVER